MMVALLWGSDRHHRILKGVSLQVLSCEDVVNFQGEIVADRM